MRRILLIPTLFLLVLGVVCFIISAGPFSSSEVAERAMVIGSADDVKTLDPGKMTWMNDIRCAMALFEGLTMYDTRDKCQPMPGVAQGWEITADRRTYTFHLRAEARWSNGDAVTADDFVFAWRRALNPATGADYIGLLKYIEGAEELTAALEKKQANAPLPGVKKIDAHTLQVHLKAPCTYFLDLLAMPVFFPLHQKSMEPYRLEDGSYDEAFTQAPHLVSNGAFTLAQWRVKRDLTMTPNPYYWDKGNVHCPGLRFEAVSDPRAALMQFESGAIDLYTSRPLGFTDVMLEQQRREHKWPELHSTAAFGTYYYIVNTARKPFDDKRVRKALALAIDRKKLTDILKAGEVPLGLFVPPNTINGYGSPAPTPFDPEAARRLLAEAGYPGGRGIKPVEIVYNSEALHDKIAQAVGQMWRSNLGVSVTYKGLERGSFGTTRRVDRNFDIARGGWYGDYPDPTTWLDLLRSTDGNNDGKFSSKAYDELLARSDAEADPAARFAILKEAENMVVNEELPIIPLYQYADGYMYDAKKIQGAELNPRLLMQLKWIRRVR
jgi:oligopeptide transport system substrate-binding protein